MYSRLNHKRIIAATLLIWLAPQLLGFLSGLSMSYWEFYGDTMQEALANAKTTRFLVIGLAWYLLYLGFLRNIRDGWLPHVTIVFFSVELLAIVMELSVWRAPPL